MAEYNDFCLECTGGNRDEIKECTDKNCPFFRNRRSNLPYQERKKDARKLHKNTKRG